MLKSLLAVPMLAVAMMATPTAASWPAMIWDEDPDAALQYGISQNGTDQVWRDYGAIGDPRTTIAVIDTGIDVPHPDLLANLWMNTAEANGQADVDEDRNGLVDDVIGYDFLENKPTPQDANGHGTHVAGIAAAYGGNGIGIAGQCPRCTLMTLRVRKLDSEDPLDSRAARAVEYAVAKGAAVILIPWGTTAELPLFRAALKAASDAGRVIVTAAGNEGVDLAFAPVYPAKYKLPGLIAAAALYRSPAGFPFWTNFGSAFVQLSSGGAEVYSTWLGGTYAVLNGTAMAAAQIAGAAALIKSYRPGLTGAQIVDRMKATLPDPDSAASTVFGGRPDMPRIFSGL